jgi:hypothetical protein
MGSSQFWPLTSSFSFLRCQNPAIHPRYERSPVAMQNAMKVNGLRDLSLPLADQVAIPAMLRQQEAVNVVEF